MLMQVLTEFSSEIVSIEYNNFFFILLHQQYDTNMMNIFLEYFLGPEIKK